MAGTLYLIPCPISEDTLPYDVTPEGNRSVITSLDYFIVENLRSARRFLSKAGLSGKIDELEFDELSEHTTSPRNVERMVAKIRAGRSAGVISEAGVPAVADPGQLVVEACHRAGIRIVPLVGPSSIIMAVMASGLSGQSFAFNGYLPVKEPDCGRAIKRLESRAIGERQSQVVIEAPYRNIRLAEAILRHCQPETRLAIACDISSPTEYIKMQSVVEWRRTQLPDIQKRPTIFIIGRL